MWSLAATYGRPGFCNRPTHVDVSDSDVVFSNFKDSEHGGMRFDTMPVPCRGYAVPIQDSLDPATIYTSVL